MNTKDILELIDSIDVLNAGRTAERLGELKDMIAELDKAEQPRVALTKPIIEVRKVLGEWAAHFTIGNQTFCLQPCGEEEDAAWYGDMLRKAFSNLAPAAGLTVEEIDRIVEEERWNIMPISSAVSGEPSEGDEEERAAMREEYLTGFEAGLRFARDNGYLAPSNQHIVWCHCGDEIVNDTGARCGNCASKPAAGLTVEEVLGLVLDTEVGYNSTVGDLMNVVMIQKIRARLTAAMNAKTTKP